MNDYGDLFRPMRSARGGIHGVVVGVVTNNKDPEGLGRVKVELPWLSDADESNWARVAFPMAGKEGSGVYFLPEVEDEVLIAFEHGRIERPVVLGALWNGKDKPPADNSDGKNNLRVIKSRSGHTITLDDTQGSETITIVDGKQKNSIVFDAAKGSLSITSEGDVTLKATGKLELQSDAEIAIKSKKITIQGDGQVAIKGTAVDINDGKLKVV